MSSARRYRRHPAGFTLVELLVVIGIIGLLMSILLPTLGAVRRKAQTIKCMSALREIGIGFSIYEKEHNGMWPVAVHAPGNTQYPVTVEMRWPDMIARFISGAGVDRYDEIDKIRQNSVIWGCPAWIKQDENDGSFTDRVRVGYGMNPYPSYFQDYRAANVAYIQAGQGRYPKRSYWSRPTERGLIADAVAHVIQTPDSFSSAGRWQPYDPVAGGAFYVDGSRHTPDATKAKSYTAPGMNMLFCDGHVSQVNVREAWNAIHNPGYDRAGP